MELWHWILAGWLAFDLVIYIWAWYDNFYYSHDLKNKFRKLKELITEE